MSDTPRTDAQAAHCEELCAEMGWGAACRAVLHMAYWSEIMEARARRNGRIAWGMRRELATGTQERDGLRDDLAAARYAIKIDKATEDDLVCQLAEARRQVDALIKQSSNGCPPDRDYKGPCEIGTTCEDHWRDWSANEARKGVAT